MAPQEKKPIPGFNQAEIETEVDAGTEEFGAEYPTVGPQGEGAEIEVAREMHAEPPPSERGYRKLNE